MSQKNAHDFVAAMRDTADYRQAVRQAAADDKLSALLGQRGHQFELRHLVVAMAACMDEMARGCDGDPS